MFVTASGGTQVNLFFFKFPGHNKSFGENRKLIPLIVFEKIAITFFLKIENFLPPHLNNSQSHSFQSVMFIS